MFFVNFENKCKLIYFAIILLLQGFFIGNAFYGQFYKLQQGTGIELVIGYIPSVTRVLAKFLILLFSFVIYLNFYHVIEHIKKNFNIKNLIIHFLLYFGLYLALYFLIVSENHDNLKILISIAYYLIAVAWVYLTATIITSWVSIKCVVKDNKFILLIAFILLVVDQLSVVYNVVIENYFHALLFNPTVSISSRVLELMGYQVNVNVQLLQLSTHNFSVEIAPSCLGYQGVSLAFLFLGVYLYVMRRDFRFPQALVVLPAAVMALLVLNSVRIAFLVAIGSSWSEDVAINGFHRVGGWVNLIGVSSLMLFILHRTTWASSANRSTQLNFYINKENSQLVPQLALISCTLLTLLFTGQFDWLYPVRVVIVGAVFVFFRKIIDFKWVRPDLPAVFLGILVFAIWMAMVSRDEAKDAAFNNVLSTVSVQWLYIWIIFRVIGAIIIVPLAEELAFRGFIVNRLKHYLRPFLNDNLLHWGAASLSSLFFGLLHGDWLAGIVAGFIFYYAMNRRQQLSDAVVAHSVANLLISIYVLSTNHWSYW